MAEEIEALLKDLRRKNSAKRRAIMLKESVFSSPADLKAKKESSSSKAKVTGDGGGILGGIHKVLPKKTEGKKHEYEELALRIEGKK